MFHPPGLHCQICLVDWNHPNPNPNHFHGHLKTNKHRKNKGKVFHKDVVKSVYLDHIPSLRQSPRDPYLGLPSLVTLYMSSESGSLFYLCHACEESVSDIKEHFTSTEHCRNYYNYTNPDILRFSWIHNNHIELCVDTAAHRDTKKNWELHTGRMQVVDMPRDLFDTVKGTSYVKAMKTLSHNPYLLGLKRTTAARPKKMSIQTYLGTANRKHPLLGLEHLVECSCEEQTDRRLYLCTVCKLTLTDTKIIRHLLSFYHIHRYINAWHPSTLQFYSSYTYNHMFHNMMRDLAKQMEEIHGTTITDMKKVVLEPALFSSVEDTYYAEALKMLEDWRKERKESSLMTRITPGDKLVLSVCFSVHVPDKLNPSSTSPKRRISYTRDFLLGLRNCPAAQRNPEFFFFFFDPQIVLTPSQSHTPLAAKTPLQSQTPIAAKRPLQSQTPVASKGPSQPQTSLAVKRPSQTQTPLAAKRPSWSQTPQHQSASSVATRGDISYVLSCQVCSMKFETTSQYSNHVKGEEHKQKMKTIFVTEADELENGRVYYSTIFNECQYMNAKKRHWVKGLHHVVTCVCSRANSMPLCVCCLCQSTFPGSKFRAHLGDPTHIKQTVVHQNAAQLPVVSEGVLKPQVREEEENAHMMLKIIDLPSRIFGMLNDDYQHVCKTLDEYLCKDWQLEEPNIVTFDELQDSHTSPQQLHVPGEQTELCQSDVSTEKQNTSITPLHNPVSTRRQGDVSTEKAVAEARETFKSKKKQKKKEERKSPGFGVLSCQVCNWTVENTKDYCAHVQGRKHMQKMKTIFVTEAGELEKGRVFFNISTCQSILSYLKSTQRAEPVIGLLHVVTCVSSQGLGVPLSVCSVCRCAFLSSYFRDHMCHPIHIQQTLTHQNINSVTNPHVSERVLTSLAWKQENAQGPGPMVLKIIELPNRIFAMLSNDYWHVCQILNTYFRKDWQHEVPNMVVTLDELQDGLTSPQLAIQGSSQPQTFPAAQGPSESQTPLGVQGPSQSNTPMGAQGPSESTTLVGVQGPPQSPTPLDAQGPSQSPTPLDAQGPSQSPTPLGAQGPPQSETALGVQGPSESTTPVGVQGPSQSETPLGAQGPPESETPLAVKGPSQSETPMGAQGPSESETPHHQSSSAKCATAEPPGGEMTAQHPTNTEPPTAVSKLEAKHPVMFCVLSCQVCNMKFQTTWQYFSHVKGGEHKQKMKTIFVTEADELEKGRVLYSSILTECQYIKKEQRAEPVIGLLHVVMCVSARTNCTPHYLCLVCKCTFSASDFKAHLCDPSHIKHTLMHQSPARLPSAWNGSECEEVLTSLAWQEENAQGPEHMVIKIIDLPCNIFYMLSDDYQHVCQILDELFRKDWQHEEPNIVLLDELQDSLTSPQLVPTATLKEIGKERPDVKDPTPLRPDVKNKPIPVEKEAVPVEDSCVHKPEEKKKCPTQNTSVERRADKETLKQSTEKGKEEETHSEPCPEWVQRPAAEKDRVMGEAVKMTGVMAEAEAVKMTGVMAEAVKMTGVMGEAVKMTGVMAEAVKVTGVMAKAVKMTGVMGEAVKVTGRRQSSEVQDTSRKRKGDAGEEDETERGTTSEDAAPRRVERDPALDLGSETESGTSERKRQKRREEDAAPADWPDVLQGVWPLVRRDVNHTPPHSTLEQEAVPEKDPCVHEPDGRDLHDLRKEKELVAEQDTLHGLQPQAPHQPADALAESQVTHNIQVSPTPPQGLQTPPSTSDCQPRPSTLISDVQDEPFSADLQQPQVQEPTSRCHCHPQVTPEDIMDPTVTNTALWHYLNNTERTEPVIGLSMMTEFQWPMENNARNYFRCHCCSRDIIRSQHMSHIVSAKHRYNYIKKASPRMVRDWPSSVEPNERPRELRDLAQQVERDEGWGRLKVTVMRSSTSQSPKATAKSPLKARVTSKTTDVSLKMNEDLKMILISKTVAELTELSKNCLTEDTSQTVYRGNVITASPHTDAESTMTSDVPTEGNGIFQSPNQGSQSSPVHTLPPDTQPESPQSCDVQPESYEDPRRTQLWAPHDPMTQSRAPHDLMTRPWAPHDPMAQPWAPQIPGTWQQAPQDCDTQPWAPLYSSSAPWYQSAPQDPGGIQPQDPEEPRDRRSIKLEETQKQLVCPDRQMTFLDPEPPVCQSSSAGEMIASRVSLFLNVKLSEAERKRVVGLRSVLECQCGDISKNERLAPFYLCCSCLKTFQLQNIIGHIISLDHQLKYMWEKYPKMMAGIWNLEDLSEKDKMDDFEVMVNRIAEQEQLYQMDAEVILLDKDSYHRVRVASFNEGMQILESCRPPEADKSTDNEETDNIVKTEPVAEHMSDRPHPERVATMNTRNSTITVTIKQEVKQEDHTHSCLSGHTEMRKAVKHGLDDVSSNEDEDEDGETGNKRRRISKSPDGRKLELVLNSLKILASSNFNLESPPLSPVSAASTEPSATPWFTEPRTQTAPKPVDNIVTNYADRQFTSESQAADAIDYDQPPESYYRAAHPAAGEDLPVASSPQPDCNQNFSVGEPSAVNTNPALASQAGIYNTTVSPFNIGASSINPSVSLPAAGYYGTPVYPYSQLTQNPYFTHGYPSGTGTQNPYFTHGYPSGTGTQNPYFTHGYPYGTGPAGIHRDPEQHPVFSQYVNYSVGSTGGLNPVETPPQQGTGQYVIPGGAYTTNPPAEAWLEMQRQQQPQ